MKLLLLQTTVFLGLYFPLATKATSAQFPSRPTVEDEETLHGSLRTRELKKTAAPTPPGKALKPAAPAPTPKPTKAPKPAPAPKPTKAPKPNGKTPGGGTSTSNTDRAVYNPGDCIPFKNVPQHVLDSTLAKSTNISDKDRKEGFDEASYTVCLVENGCNTGGCRYYNWLVCDKVGALPWLRFVCNDGFATPPPVIPISTTNIPIRSDNTTGGVIFGLDGSIIPRLSSLIEVNSDQTRVSRSTPQHSRQRGRLQDTTIKRASIPAIAQSQVLAALKPCVHACR